MKPQRHAITVQIDDYGRFLRIRVQNVRTAEVKDFHSWEAFMAHIRELRQGSAK